MYPQMSQEEFKINYEYLTEQLDKIIKKGWIKCTKKGKGASGLILEQLLGKTEENFEYPDYYEFELKVKSYFKYDTLGLFCAVPDSNFFEIKRILETYSKFSYGYKYYKYKDYTIYKLKDFDTFIDLIESGDISINFCIDYFQNGKRAGDVHDHGTSFHIKCRSINKLFDKIS